MLYEVITKLSGDKSFSSYVIRVVKAHAEKILAKNDRIIASEKDRERFFEAVFGESQPNEKLREAAEKYKSQM